MSKILLIVESPGKIKKIQSYVGDKYIVAASVGHIIDLDSRSMSVDIENNFEPKYINSFNKSSVIRNLRGLAKNCSDVLIATDMDREGEMIGWSNDLRSATEGRGTSSILDQLFEKVPTNLQDNIIRRTRDRKGLS